MAEKKKLIGVYLPLSLINRLKTFIMKLFLKTGEQKTQSDVSSGFLPESPIRR